ncbi:MAG: alpha/beta fold hydrolase [Jatrophihabitans sp.]
MLAYRRIPIRGVLAIAAVVMVTSGLMSTPAAAATNYPVTRTLAGGIAKALPDPSASPAGVNPAHCTPTSAHPNPVVLVNGTFANMVDDWSGLGPVLANLGYCVYGTALGASPHSFIQTIGSVPASAQQLATFVDSVRSRTGAAKVDLVGHSQGGMLAEYYTKVLGGAAKVNAIVGLSPSTHGTTLLGLGTLASAFPGGPVVVAALCPACADQLTGSSVIRRLDSGPIAQPGVKYTIIETYYEFVVTPAGSAFIREPGVNNIWLQHVCPFNLTGHASLPYDKGVQSLVRNALDPAHPKPVSCF